MEYYATMKNKRPLLHLAAEMNLQDLLKGEGSETQKSIYWYSTQGKFKDKQN